MLIGIVDIIKNSVEFYIKNWKKFAIYLPILFIPTIILVGLGIFSVNYGFLTEGLQITSTLLVVVASIAGVLFNIWVTIALSKTIKKIHHNEPIEDWKKTISNNSYLIWPVLLTSIMTTVLVVIGSILFLIPGILFFIWYVFTFHTVIFDNKRGIEALKASKELVVGRWWQIFWRIVIPGLSFGILLAILNNILMIPVNYYLITDTVPYKIAISILSAITNIFITPLVSYSIILLYFSAKENPIKQNLATIEEATGDESLKDK